MRFIQLEHGSFGTIMVRGGMMTTSTLECWYTFLFDGQIDIRTWSVIELFTFENADHLLHLCQTLWQCESWLLSNSLTSWWMWLIITSSGATNITRCSPLLQNVKHLLRLSCLLLTVNTTTHSCFKGRWVGNWVLHGWLTTKTLCTLCSRVTLITWTDLFVNLLHFSFKQLEHFALSYLKQSIESLKLLDLLPQLMHFARLFLINFGHQWTTIMLLWMLSDVCSERSPTHFSSMSLYFV